ncbi:MAG: hypothetical protein AAF449_04990 [Myxococcota bacterium]
MNKWPWFVAAVLIGACGVEERADFLIGRLCTPSEDNSCDPGQACLPHAWDGIDQFSDFRCRDEASLLRPDAPIAYCNDEEHLCTGLLVCNADRVRLDVSIRPRVCKPEDDIFAPPFDGGM